MNRIAIAISAQRNSYPGQKGGAFAVDRVRIPRMPFDDRVAFTRDDPNTEYMDTVHPTKRLNHQLMSVGQ